MDENGYLNCDWWLNQLLIVQVIIAKDLKGKLKRQSVKIYLEQ